MYVSNSIQRVVSLDTFISPSFFYFITFLNEKLFQPENEKLRNFVVKKCQKKISLLFQRKISFQVCEDEMFQCFQEFPFSSSQLLIKCN